MPKRWGDVEGYGMTDAEREGKGPVDLPIQSQIACIEMRDSSRNTMESRGKRVRKHRVESASADDSGFLFRSEQIEGTSEQIEGTKTRTGTGLRAERTFPGKQTEGNKTRTGTGLRAERTFLAIVYTKNIDLMMWQQYWGRGNIIHL